MSEVLQKANAAFEHNMTRCCLFSVGAMLSDKKPTGAACIFLAVAYLLNALACKAWPDFMCENSKGD